MSKFSKIAVIGLLAISSQLCAVSMREDWRDFLVEEVIAIKYLFNSNNVIEVDCKNYPELDRMVIDLSAKAGIKKPLTFLITKKCPGFFDKANACAVGDKDSSAVFIGSWITDGMSKDEVEGVLAHEIAHISKDHIMKNFTVSMVASALAVGVAIGTSMVLAKKTNSKLLPFFIPSFILTNLGAAAVTAYHSRKCEREADLGAIDLTDHKELAQSLKKLDAIYRKYCPYSNRQADLWYNRIFASHPQTEKREQDIRTYRSRELVKAAA